MITGILMALGLAIGIIFIIAFCSIFYIVECMGIMKLMEAEGLQDRFKAWIPFYNAYILGEITESEIADSSFVFVGVTKWIFALFPLASAVPAIGPIASAAGAIYCIVVLCIFADKYNTTASMVVSSIFALSGIGMMILSSRIQAVNPGKVMEKAEPKEPAAKVVEFEVEKNDIEAKPENPREMIVAKPDEDKE